MRIVFAHGLESGPEGRKTAWLREAGYDVVSPDARRLDLEQRVERLLQVLRPTTTPTLLVGSSFGGIAGLLAGIHAARAGCGPRGLLLLAPALQWPIPPRWACELAPPCACAVVHGLRDTIIVPEIGEAWARRWGARWIPCDDDHGLAASREVVLGSLAELIATAT